jgi:hypothetical protein
MSKVKITGHASGSGTITLTGPNTSSDRTITLPDATGTALMTDGSGASLTALNGTQVTSGTVPVARMAAGTVVSYKIVTVNPGGGISTTSTTFVEASSSLRIAHAMAASGNKLIFSLSTIDNYANAAQAWYAVTSLADVTTNLESKALGYVKSGQGTEPFSTFCTQEHSPGNTNTITYCISFKTGGSGTAYLNNTPSTGQVNFSLMEIAQ